MNPNGAAETGYPTMIFATASHSKTTKSTSLGKVIVMTEEWWLQHGFRTMIPTLVADAEHIFTAAPHPKTTKSTSLGIVIVVTEEWWREFNAESSPMPH